MRMFFAIGFILLSVSAVAAGATAWQDLAPGVRARLISSDVLTDGETTVGLQLDMPQNTKTYWRIPGETGIPTEVDADGSTGISGSEILWPYPTRDIAEGFLDYAYFGPTVLPIALTLKGSEADFDAAVTMGICSDICVPASAHFNLALRFEKPDRGQQLRLNQALALVPKLWAKGSDPFGAVSLDPVNRALNVLISDPAIDPGSLIAIPGDSPALFGAPQKSPDGTLLALPLLGDGAIENLAGKPVEFTFVTASGSFFLWRDIAP